MSHVYVGVFISSLIDNACMLFVTRTHDRRTPEWEVVCGLGGVIGYLLLRSQRL
jgi:hypothetical protein